jgi:hypothetical protein
MILNRHERLSISVIRLIAAANLEVTRMTDIPQKSRINTVQTLLINIGFNSFLSDFLKRMNTPPLRRATSLVVKTRQTSNVDNEWDLEKNIPQRAVLQKILSASGSRRAPNRDSALNFLAVYPSKKSVRDARKMIKKETGNESRRMLNMKIGAHKIRRKQRRFGI